MTLMSGDPIEEKQEKEEWRRWRMQDISGLNCILLRVSGFQLPTNLVRRINSPPSILPIETVTTAKQTETAVSWKVKGRLILYPGSPLQIRSRVALIKIKIEEPTNLVCAIQS